MTSRYCAGCSQVLGTSWITALDRQWHETCFVCTRCRRPIRGQSFLVHEGGPYHEECHRLEFGKKCYVCGQYVEGRYFEDAWGCFCSTHRSKGSCFGCGKIVAAEGGVRLNDGRQYCATCHLSAIADIGIAKRHMPVVISFLGKMGLPIRGEIELRFIPYESSGGGAKRLGVTKTQITTGALGRIIARRVEYIGVLDHLPVLQLQETFAHELFHVWAFQQELQLPELVEEGMAQLCAWKYLGEKAAGKHGEVAKRLLEDNRNPVYGGGFRAAQRSLEKFGLAALIRHLVERGNFS